MPSSSAPSSSTLLATKRFTRPASLSFLAVLLATLPVSWAQDDSKPPSEWFDPRAMVSAAEEKHDAGEIEAASRLYRKAVFISPEFRKASSGWMKLRKERAEALAEEAEELWKTDQDRSMDLLQQAADLNLKDRTVKKLCREHGLKEFRGLLRTQVEIDDYELELEEIEKARRARLNLGEEYSILYHGPFRVFTNVDVRKARSTLAQVTASVESHWRSYLQVMGPFELRNSTDLDIVVFDQQSEYMEAAGIPGSAGVYIPSRGAGYFFREGGWNFATMLHEMTHQLNDKLLRGHHRQAWFEEGISEYFGSAFLTQGGKRIELGRVEASRLRDFQAAVRGVSGRVIPFEYFVRMPAAELSGEFYAQAWALFHYLMEVHPYGRAILFDYIEGIQTGQGTDIATLLDRYGIGAKKFGEEFQEYYRTGGQSD